MLNIGPLKGSSVCSMVFFARSKLAAGYSRQRRGLPVIRTAFIINSKSYHFYHNQHFHYLKKF